MPKQNIIQAMLDEGKLSLDEKNLIETPLNELTLDLRSIAFSIGDKIDAYVAELNKDFVPQQFTKVHIQTDYINGAGGAIQSMADGKMYDSKSKYYKSLKAQGMVIADEPPKPPKPKEVDWERAVADTVNRIKGY